MNKQMTDTDRLDFLQDHMKGYGYGWICRDSDSGRGLRLHETSHNEAVWDIRKAIDNFIEKEIVKQIQEVREKNAKKDAKL